MERLNCLEPYLAVRAIDERNRADLGDHFEAIPLDGNPYNSHLYLYNVSYPKACRLGRLEPDSVSECEYIYMNL